MSPLSPRVKEFETEIEHAELIPAMARIRAGSVLVGRKKSDRNTQNRSRMLEIDINAFRIGKYEVTFAEYDRFAEETNRPKPDDNGWGRGNRPVINVLWQDAIEYANWLSAKLGASYRLPTSAEWAYAAQAGKATNYPWGDEVGRNRANCQGCRSRYDGQTAPIGSFRPNAWGLHDVAGNVCEWTCSNNAFGHASGECATDVETEDEEENPLSAIFKIVAPLLNVRVCRGASWDYGPRYLLSIDHSYQRDHKAGTLGFRLAQE